MQERNNEDGNYLVTTDSVRVLDKNADIAYEDQISVNSLRLFHDKSSENIQVEDKKTPGLKIYNSKSNFPKKSRQALKSHQGLRKDKLLSNENLNFGLDSMQTMKN